MASLAALGAAFALVALSELGDKTQLAVVSLASRHSRRAVLLGAILAEVVMAAVAVTVGVALWLTVPVLWIQVASGLAFLAIGAYLLWRRGVPERKAVPAKDERTAFGSTFALVALGEFGDKTQLAIIALAASLAAPGEVFVGASLAMVLMMGIAVVVGDRLARSLKPKTLGLVGAALFLVAGALLLAETALP
jgi:putative Ca2+/H+ antiporter (TMEM165/GDT1 family)